MRKLCATPAAPELHVEPVIHHNSAAASRGARVQPLRLAQCSAAGTRRGRGAQTRGCEEKERFPLTAMQTGVSTEFSLSRLILCFLSLFMLMHLSLSAPGLPGTERDESALSNPFAPADRGLLQSYIQSTLKEEQIGPEMNTWEQEVFFLVRLFDFDRTGLLDGLEMMQLLTDYNSNHAPGAHANNEQVISVVDFLLQTQDLNQDGLLAPSELLSTPLPQSQDASNNNAPPKEEQEVAHTSPDEETQGAQDRKEKNQAHDMQPQSKEQVQQEVTMNEEEMQLSQVPATDLEQDQEVSVHQGQPEI